jgi:hypothetical protein
MIIRWFGAVLAVLTLFFGWSAYQVAHASNVGNSTGISNVAMAAYMAAAKGAPCPVDVATLAGIGYVETKHGTYGGSHLDLNGTATPPIVGLPLNGGGPQQALTIWQGQVDVAAGPMQFTSATWATYGQGGDVQNVRDAAAAAARYLCAHNFQSSPAVAIGAYNDGTGTGPEGIKYAAQVAAYAATLPALSSPSMSGRTGFGAVIGQMKRSTAAGWARLWGTKQSPIRNALTPTVDALTGDGTASAVAGTGDCKLDLVHLKAQTVRLYNAVLARFGCHGRMAGWRSAASDSISGGDHPDGTALDVYADPATMKLVYDWARKQPGVKYVIHNGMIDTTGQDGNEHRYNPPAGETDHATHVHISLLGTAT